MNDNKKRVYRLAFAGVTSVLILGFTGAKEYERRQLLNQHKALLASLATEIDIYKNLGFDDQDQVVQTTVKRLEKTRHKIDFLRSPKSLFLSDASAAGQDKKMLRDLIQVNRKMIHNYNNQIQHYKDGGLTDEAAEVKFAQESLLKLIQEVKVLELQLNENNAMPQAQLNAIIEKMLAINQQSLDLYKQEILRYKELGLSWHDPKMVAVRQSITNKVSEIQELEAALRTN